MKFNSFFFWGGGNDDCYHVFSADVLCHFLNTTFRCIHGSDTKLRNDFLYHIHH